jgi:hypothetical protein
MKPTRNRAFASTPDLQIDLEKNFDSIWQELEKRERAQPDAANVPSKLRLECNGELVDIGWVDGIALVDAALSLQLIQFLCPRCGRAHQSLRFR